MNDVCSFHTAQLTHSETGIQFDIICWTFIIYTWIRKSVCNLSPSWQYLLWSMTKWAVEFSGYGFQRCTPRGASGARSVLDIVGGFTWHQKLKQLHHLSCKTFCSLWTISSATATLFTDSAKLGSHNLWFAYFVCETCQLPVFRSMEQNFFDTPLVVIYWVI